MDSGLRRNDEQGTGEEYERRKGRALRMAVTTSGNGQAAA